MSQGGVRWKVKAGYRQAEHLDLGHMSLLGLSGVTGGSWAKAGLVNSNKKEWGSGKLRRGLIHQGTGKGLGAGVC